jgi:VWFA-related protein
VTLTRAAAIACALSAGVVLTAQQPSAPIFRSGTDAVLLDVRVVDRDGHFVPDLTKDDFRVLLNGKSAQITTFDLVNVPQGPDARPTFSGAPVDPDVASNSREDGRIYVIVLDDYHAHELRGKSVRQLAHEFIEHHFAEGDRAAIVTTSGRKALVQEFTNNRKRLLDAADRFEGGYLAGAMCGEQGATGRCDVQEARSALHSLSALATWLGTIGGSRKALVFISEGFDGGMGSAFDPAGTIEDAEIDALAAGSASKSARSDAQGGIAADMREVIEEANRANVAIYAIDPAGLPGGPTSGITPVPMLDGDDPFSARQAQARITLQILARATGGFALTRSNAFADAFTRLVDQVSTYYLLGIDVGGDKSPRIEVKTSRGDVRIEGRRSYVPPRRRPGAAVEGPAGALNALMKSPLSVPGLSLRVAAIPFAGTKGKASVEIVTDVSGRDLQFLDSPEGARNRLDLLMVISDVEGKVKASERGSLDMSLSASTHQSVAENGVRVFSRLEVSPGKYTLRVAGVDNVGETRGSVQYDLDVPDFGKGPLAASALAIATLSDPPPTTGSDRKWQDRFPQAPTTGRTFARTDELKAFGEAYANGGKAQSIDAVTEVTSEDGRSLFVARRSLRADAAKPGVFGYEATIPLVAFPPGNYLLTVTFTEPQNAKATAARRVPFAVSPGAQ